MTLFVPITGPWGTHWADAPQADDWIAETLRRVDAARQLCATRAGWAAQRDAVVSAWSGMGDAYRSANGPPPSDPLFRAVMTSWYGRCHTTPEAFSRYEVGPLTAQGGRTIIQRVNAAWSTIRPGDPNSLPGRCRVGDCAYFPPVPVRVCLGSDGNVTMNGLDPDPMGCFVRANPDASGRFREVSCTDANYDANTLQSGNDSVLVVPLTWSLDVLADLLAKWQARGNASRAIDASRSFVAVSNVANARLSGVLPAEFAVDTLTLGAEATRLSTGANPTRAIASSAIGIATAACAAAAGPFAPACVVVGGVAALLANVLPMAIGTPTDSLGMPEIDARQTASFLAPMIAPPDDAGHVTLDVPPVTASRSIAGSAGLVVPLNLSPGARAAMQRPLPMTRSTQAKDTALPDSPGLALVGLLVLGTIIVYTGHKAKSMGYGA